MKLSENLALIGAQMELFHMNTGTSLGLTLSVSDRAVIYVCNVASVEGQAFQFKQAQSLIDWLVDVNSDVDPLGSAMKRQRAEALKETKIIKDAELAALEKEIGELPQTQVIADATKAAEQIKQESDYRLEKLQQAADILASEAAEKQQILDDELAKVSAEVVAKAAELIAKDLEEKSK